MRLEEKLKIMSVVVSMYISPEGIPHGSKSKLIPHGKKLLIIGGLDNNKYRLCLYCEDEKNPILGEVQGNSKNPFGYSIDHIIPINSKEYPNGSCDCNVNLVCLHYCCNKKKGNKIL